MRVVERRAGKLELSSRLERDRAFAVGVIEPDQRAAVLDALPAEMGAHPLEQRLDPALAFIRDGRPAGAIERDLLMLRADPEWTGRLASGLEPRDQRVAQFHNFTVDDIASHSGAHTPGPAARRTG